MSVDLERAEVELDVHVETGDNYWRLLWALLLLHGWDDDWSFPREWWPLRARLREVFRTPSSLDPFCHAKVCSCTRIWQKSADTPPTGPPTGPLAALMWPWWQAYIALSPKRREIYTHLGSIDSLSVQFIGPSAGGFVVGNRLAGHRHIAYEPSITFDQQHSRDVLERKLANWMI